MIDEIALRIFARKALRDGYYLLSDPFGFFASMREEGREKSTHRTVRYILAWFIMFSIVPSLLLPVWRPLTDWAIEAAVVKIPDLHFENAVYLTIARDIYPLVYSYLGNHLPTWLVSRRNKGDPALLIHDSHRSTGPARSSSKIVMSGESTSYDFDLLLTPSGPTVLAVVSDC